MTTIPVSEPVESKDEFQYDNWPLPPAGTNDDSGQRRSPRHQSCLLLNGQDLVRVWDEIDTIKAETKKGFDELRSKMEENSSRSTLDEYSAMKGLQSELNDLRQKLCESIDNLGIHLKNQHSKVRKCNYSYPGIELVMHANEGTDA